MRNATPTMFGAAFQIAKSTGMPHYQKKYSTLNEAIRHEQGYLSEFEPVDVNYPAENVFNPIRDTINMQSRYLTLGQGALTNRSLGDGRTIPVALPHRTTDAGWYRPLPFALFPEGQDFDRIERQRYRLRRHLSINGRVYVGYFLRVMDFSGSEVEYNRFVNQDGEMTDPTLWEPQDIDLRPTLPPLPTNNVLPNDGIYYAATLPTEVTFTRNEIERIVEAAAIMNGGIRESAVISEWGFVSAADCEVRVPGTGPEAIEYTDVLGAQVDSWVTSVNPVYGASSLTRHFDIGRAEPIYGGDRT